MKSFTRIYHIAPHQNRAATIALELIPEQNLVTASWAVCWGDNFSRKKGVEIALSRPETFTFRVKSYNNLLDRFFKALYYEYGGSSIPLCYLIGDPNPPCYQVTFLREKLFALQKILRSDNAY